MHSQTAQSWSWASDDPERPVVATSEAPTRSSSHPFHILKFAISQNVTSAIPENVNHKARAVLAADEAPTAEIRWSCKNGKMEGEEGGAVVGGGCSPGATAGPSGLPVITMDIGDHDWGPGDPEGPGVASTGSSSLPFHFLFFFGKFQ